MGMAEREIVLGLEDGERDPVNISSPKLTKTFQFVASTREFFLRALKDKFLPFRRRNTTWIMQEVHLDTTL